MFLLILLLVIELVGSRSKEPMDPRTHNQESSPFDKLPDELLLKITKSVIESHEILTEGADISVWIPRHDLLLNTIARISTRFRRIAADKSLWISYPCPCPCFNLNVEDMRRLESPRHNKRYGRCFKCKRKLSLNPFISETYETTMLAK